MGDILLWFQLHLHRLFSQGIKGKQTKATLSNVYVSTNQAPRTPYKYIQQSLWATAVSHLLSSLKINW